MNEQNNPPDLSVNLPIQVGWLIQGDPGDFLFGGLNGTN